MFSVNHMNFMVIAMVSGYVFSGNSLVAGRIQSDGMCSPYQSQEPILWVCQKIHCPSRNLISKISPIAILPDFCSAPDLRFRRKSSVEKWREKNIFLKRKMIFFFNQNFRIAAAPRVLLNPGRSERKKRFFRQEKIKKVAPGLRRAIGSRPRQADTA